MLVVDGGDTNLLAANIAPTAGRRYDSLLKFDVSSLGHRGDLIDSVILRLYVADGSPSGGTFHTTVDTSWDEFSVAWDTAPAADGYSIGTLDRVTAGDWIEVDLTAALSWNQALTGGSDYMSIRIHSQHSNRCQYNSVDNVENAPHLAVRFLQNAAEEPESVDSYHMAILDPGINSPTESPTRSPIAQVIHAPGEKLVLKATDDATIVADTPTLNFGYRNTLTVKGDVGIIDSVLRFNIAELRSVPKSMVLALYVEEGSNSAGTFATTAPMDWSEGDVTWSSAPTHEPGVGLSGGSIIGTFGPVIAGKWYGFDVTSTLSEGVLRERNTLTFRLSSNQSNQCKYSSVQSGRAPKLMITF